MTNILNYIQDSGPADIQQEFMQHVQTLIKPSLPDYNKVHLDGQLLKWQITRARISLQNNNSIV
jgi:hypothetical protein